jgi:PTH1 family peptidyl-tRNA hydrolase
LKAVVGLGNPGREYVDTPHNAGFAVVDLLASRWDASLRRSWRVRARTGGCMHAGEKVLLVEPQTFMNRSGEAVSWVLRYNKLGAEDLIVVVDDADLPAGRVRIRAKGTSGGHNGLESVIGAVGTRDFVRVRVGIGRGEGKGRGLIGHVLSPLRGEGAELLGRGIETAADAVQCLIENGVDRAMNEFNGSMREGDSDGKPE